MTWMNVCNDATLLCSTCYCLPSNPYLWWAHEQGQQAVAWTIHSRLEGSDHTLHHTIVNVAQSKQQAWHHPDEDQGARVGGIAAHKQAGRLLSGGVLLHLWCIDRTEGAQIGSIVHSHAQIDQGI